MVLNCACLGLPVRAITKVEKCDTMLLRFCLGVAAVFVLFDILMVRYVGGFLLLLRRWKLISLL